MTFLVVVLILAIIVQFVSSFLKAEPPIALQVATPELAVASGNYPNAK